MYGEIVYDGYSFEKRINQTYFLTKVECRQDSLPAKDAPPDLSYDILKTKFSFVYRIAKEQLFELPEWRENMSYHPIGNELFGTLEAYQKYYANESGGEYILFYQDTIIVLNMEESASVE